ncbi:hypothetical protein HHS34_013530 [Acidithiobacillus montserratensis]|uniref:Uncharacterized protein n=1 Tax=Acidithiobacillus montserratensis TaxID=2729135 RepID=A0ACD5HEZ8_9PROT|nr:hypothetical protein [Acidithiobacillus montserratensis]MBU2749067.1 hypothetical protein [Acidithiobacillus montserratensis]
MAKYSGLQPGNPHQITRKQHIFPAKSIERFCVNNAVDVWLVKQSKKIRVNQRNPIFTGNRIWDHATERGSYGVEAEFQKIADSCVDDKRDHLGKDECEIVSAFYGLLLSRQEVLDTPRSPAVVHGVTGWDRSNYQDEMEYIESQGGHTICQVDGVAILDGRQINGFSVFTGMDRFLLENPGLEWVMAHAPSGMEFVVPDRFSSSMNGVLQHYAAIPITPGIALIAPTVFPYPRNLTVGHINVMNSIAKKMSRAYYFASNLVALL